MQFNIDIIASGSNANAVIYDEKILVDIGVNYEKLKDKLKNVKLILLTHEHGDHLNCTTLRKILVNHENIKLGVPNYLINYFDNLGINKNRYHVYKVGTVYDYKTYKIVPIKLYHDVPNVGYRIIRCDVYKHLHITDTNTVEGISAMNYDSAAIECNYEENKANNLIEIAKINEEFTHIRGSINSHLSVRQTCDFVKDNNIKRLIPLHISSAMKEEVMQYLYDENIKVGEQNERDIKSYQ